MQRACAPLLLACSLLVQPRSLRWPHTKTRQGRPSTTSAATLPSRYPASARECGFVRVCSCVYITSTYVYICIYIYICIHR
jgi:hypothetical protein